VRTIVADWRGLMGGHISEARRLLRSFLEGRVVFTPRADEFAVDCVGRVRMGVFLAGAKKMMELVSYLTLRSLGIRKQPKRVSHARPHDRNTAGVLARRPPAAADPSLLDLWPRGGATPGMIRHEPVPARLTLPEIVVTYPATIGSPPRMPSSWTRCSVPKIESKAEVAA
jgi:hypothetical protein